MFVNIYIQVSFPSVGHFGILLPLSSPSRKHCCSCLWNDRWDFSIRVVLS